MTTTTAHPKMGTQVHVFNRSDGDCSLGVVAKPAPEGVEHLAVASVTSPGHQSMLRHDPTMSRRHLSGIKPRPGGGSTRDSVRKTWHLPSECTYGR